MGLQHYTLADFRKKTKEAFDNAEDGHLTFITRHNKRYELRLAPIQGYKAQDEAIKAREDQERKLRRTHMSPKAAMVDIANELIEQDPQSIIEQMSDKVYAVDGRDPIAVVDLTTEAEQVPSTATNVHTGVTKMLKNLRSYKAPTFDPDPMSVFDQPDDIPAPKKNASDADASVEDTPTTETILTWQFTHIDTWHTVVIKNARRILQARLDTIDIDTQDPDAIERGTELAARIGDIDAELAKRGVK